jgi:hypothetical protein
MKHQQIAHHITRRFILNENWTVQIGGKGSTPFAMLLRGNCVIRLSVLDVGVLCKFFEQTRLKFVHRQIDREWSEAIQLPDSFWCVEMSKDMALLFSEPVRADRCWNRMYYVGPQATGQLFARFDPSPMSSEGELPSIKEMQEG